eukprot:NODE_2647_length_1070_cov_6.836435_g2205_i0.p3 GENE.NODE_2647_length_1070_cov_6.836435_g2205_i0~~NODE_2647_length_1070_cov_6.836435_g2205_i0.p3  ORF type:complete len:107 (+),score=24.03 NODE_2647_length_1070_cov_6.836435_g2205_i0:592-912(+)
MSTARGRHTIVLLQPTKSKLTRTFTDFESVSLAMDGLCQMYETRLRQENQNQPHITYDAADLLEFLDKITDLSCLVYSDDLHAYQPFGKEWIKKKVWLHLQSQQKE